MKKEYAAPFGMTLEIGSFDFLSISLSTNPEGNDDGGNFESLFG